MAPTCAQKGKFRQETAPEERALEIVRIIPLLWFEACELMFRPCTLFLNKGLVSI